MLLANLSSVFSQDAFGDGGALSYRLRLINEAGYQQLNSTPLNVGNKFVPQARYGNSFSSDLFLSWRDLAVDVKADVDVTDRNDPDFQHVMRELYFARSIDDHLHLTVGRRILKWGTGYAFNPTGVVEPTKDSADPSDRLNRFQGRQILALDTYFGSHSLTLLYANEFRLGEEFKWGQDELAVRFYSLIKGVDLSLIGHWKEGKKLKFGFNTAVTHGAHFEWHSEFLAQIGTSKLYHPVLQSTNSDTFFGESPYKQTYHDSKEVFYKLLLGIQYTFNSGPNLMIEYFYNREGLSITEWNRWRQFTLFHQEQITGSAPDPASYPEFYDALNTLNSNGTMRHYGFVRLYLPMQKSALELILLANLLDQSGIVIPTFTHFFNSNLSAWIRGSYFGGAHDSEFGMLFLKTTINLGIKVSL